MPPTVLLCSDGLGALDTLIADRPLRRGVLVADAADALPDGPAIVARDRRRLKSRGLDVATVGAAELGDRLDADVVVVGGGDPFHLLGALRTTGAAERLRAAVAAGTPYVGLSAGAMVAGPDLRPAARTGPFAPRAGQELGGLDLAPVLVLPHTDRPGRARRHRDALAGWAHEVTIVPLGDDDAVTLSSGEPPAVHGPQRGLRLRGALPADAQGIADVFVAAGREAWSSFLGADRMAAVEPAAAEWRDLVATRAAGHAVVVATRDGAVAGFAHADTEAGLLETLYTHPATWGGGVGRALLAVVEDVFRAAGHREAALWTEERNARARRVYEAAGWVADGEVQERDWRGARLRELRYRIVL